ncbi:MAG: peptidylprolyl isomerase, partial [Planctomycetota bacterium]
MTLRELTPFVLSLCLVGCGGDEPANTDNLQSASDLAGIDSGDETPETPNTETTDLESGGTPLIDDPSIPDVSEAPNTGETADPQPYGEQPFEAPDQGEGEQGSGEQESGEQESGEQGPGEEGESDEPTVVAGPGNNQPEATGDPTLDEIVAAIRAAEIDVESDAWRLQVPAPPEVEYDGETKYEWFLETNQGPLTIRLLPQVAPEHVTSTAYLSMLGFYDNLIFHRVIDGFMAPVIVVPSFLPKKQRGYVEKTQKLFCQDCHLSLQPP